MIVRRTLDATESSGEVLVFGNYPTNPPLAAFGHPAYHNQCDVYFPQFGR